MVFTLIEKLWTQTMQKLLDGTDTYGSNDPGKRCENVGKKGVIFFLRVIDAGTSKKILDDNMRNENFQRIFKVYGEELVQGE